MYITNYDTKQITVLSDGSGIDLTFEEAIAQGVTTQTQLDAEEKRFLEMALIEIEDAGLRDVTDEVNKQNGSNHLYVFANEKGVHYCDTQEDIFDLAEQFI